MTDDSAGEQEDLSALMDGIVEVEEASMIARMLRAALLFGSDDDVWPPELTNTLAVERLVAFYLEYRDIVGNLEAT